MATNRIALVCNHCDPRPSRSCSNGPWLPGSDFPIACFMSTNYYLHPNTADDYLLRYNQWLTEHYHEFDECTGECGYDAQWPFRAEYEMPDGSVDLHLEVDEFQHLASLLRISADEQARETQNIVVQRAEQEALQMVRSKMQEQGQ